MLKILKISILLSLFFVQVSSKLKRYCKTQILNSIGFSSRHIATEKNILCPAIEYNCCTDWTVLKMYKQWNTVTKELLKENLEENVQGL